MAAIAVCFIAPCRNEKLKQLAEETMATNLLFGTHEKARSMIFYKGALASSTQQMTWFLHWANGSS